MWIHWGCKNSILIFYVVNNFDVSNEKNENAICYLINYICNVIVIQLITLQKCG